MFPTLRQRLGDALDLVVEFSTLGEYRLGGQDAPLPSSATPAAGAIEPGMGGAGLAVGRALGRRTVAGPVGCPPADTPAARRRATGRPYRLVVPSARGRTRAGQLPAAEQHCLARD
jgi:hypothetical protein